MFVRGQPVGRQPYAVDPSRWRNPRFFAGAPGIAPTHDSFAPGARRADYRPPQGRFGRPVVATRAPVAPPAFHDRYRAAGSRYAWARRAQRSSASCGDAWAGAFGDRGRRAVRACPRAAWPPHGNGVPHPPQASQPGGGDPHFSHGDPSRGHAVAGGPRAPQQAFRPGPSPRQGQPPMAPPQHANDAPRFDHGAPTRPCNRCSRSPITRRTSSAVRPIHRCSLHSPNTRRPRRHSISRAISAARRAAPRHEMPSPRPQPEAQRPPIHQEPPRQPMHQEVRQAPPQQMQRQEPHQQPQQAQQPQQPQQRPQQQRPSTSSCG